MENWSEENPFAIEVDQEKVHIKNYKQTNKHISRGASLLRDVECFDRSLISLKLMFGDDGIRFFSETNGNLLNWYYIIHCLFVMIIIILALLSY